MLVFISAKICVTPNTYFKICVTPTRNPNAIQWNIGCVGSQTQISRFGHVHFSSFGVDFICVGSRFSVGYELISVL